MNAARVAGGQFVIKVFSWADIEPEPNYLYWEVPDATLRAAEFYGLQVVARLDRPPAWAATDSGPTPWRLDAYANFVRQVVERYGERLAGVIIWNEPNLTLEWANQPPNPAAYVEMLKAVYPVIKAVNPDLPVLLAGLAFTNDAGSNFNDLDYLQQTYKAGGAAYFDILAAHPYGFDRSPTDSPEPSQLNFRRLELHRRLMEANGDGHKPVWITEMGWRTSAPNPADAWQVVSVAEQADYLQQAIFYAAQTYPWLERMAFWELNGVEDKYGYNLWQGADRPSLAYQTLAATCVSRNPLCQAEPVYPARLVSDLQASVPILASDVTIRLGDRGTLHPHWVHLYQGGQNFSPDWQGEFFLTATQAEQNYSLLLEVMQIDQPSNRTFINGAELAYLQTRTRPDPTSTWVTQRMEVPARLLQPGVNTFRIVVGQRNPARQYSFWRWENMQFRHVRLVPLQTTPAPLIKAWTALPAPSGWSETNRLRPGAKDDFWLTGNRRGEIWRGTGGTAPLQPQAGNRPDLLFTDILPIAQGELATTDQGLFWRSPENDWQFVASSPPAYAHVATQTKARFYAGFEAQGVWSAPQPDGPWQVNGLAGQTVLDLAFDPNSEALYAATDAGMFVYPQATSIWQRLPPLPGETENSLMRFTTRLYLGPDGQVVVRNLDRLWRWTPASRIAPELGEWQSFGPPELASANKVYTVLDCCDPGAIVATRFLGLWQLAENEGWQRLDTANTFGVTDATELLRVGDDLYAAGIIGLFQSGDSGQTWQKVAGLPATVSDLLVDPTNSSRWIAATPAGVYRSQNRGQLWEAISPPWTVWDMAFDQNNRLFLARNSGIAWADSLAGESVSWQEAEGLSQVLFFSVNPQPTDPAIVWAGTWGNDIGVSDDRGQTLASLGNGLETLSVLDVLWHPTPGQVTAATIEGLYRTDDGGQSWFQLPGPLTRQTIYNLGQADDEIILAAAADGLWASADYGATWTRAEGMPITTVIRLGSFSPSKGNTWLWAGTENDGLWLSQDGGATWQLGGLEGRTIFNLFLDPLQPNRLVAATNVGIFETGFNDSSTNSKEAQ
jgi:photosystem II stability/assembly factor-like uncharacterized protein